MTRVRILLPIAALVAGCQSSSTPCQAFLNVYWAQGPAPGGGFQVPGLAAAGFPDRLGCTAAAVDGVQVRINGTIAPCSGGVCLDPQTWLCLAKGISIPISGGGTYQVQVDAFDATGVHKYTGAVSASAASCADNSVSVLSQGIAGSLGVDYAFSDTSTCQTGSDIAWDLRQGLATPFDTGSVPCGTANPFLVNGGLDFPAGVYTFESVAEVVGASAVHALCLTTFVHAGSETLLLELPAATPNCP